jgi:threonine dehydrogenase-like Zn-dependent dehydrogenase
VPQVREQLPDALQDEDPLQVDNFATHHLPLSDGPAAYEMFQQKRDGAVKVLLTP